MVGFLLLFFVWFWLVLVFCHCDKSSETQFRRREIESGCQFQGFQSMVGLCLATVEWKTCTFHTAALVTGKGSDAQLGSVRLQLKTLSGVSADHGNVPLTFFPREHSTW